MVHLDTREMENTLRVLDLGTSGQDAETGRRFVSIYIRQSGKLSAVDR